jgi:hypothetical protein
MDPVSVSEIDSEIDRLYGFESKVAASFRLRLTSSCRLSRGQPGPFDLTEPVSFKSQQDFHSLSDAARVTIVTARALLSGSLSLDNPRPAIVMMIASMTNPARPGTRTPSQ